MPLFDLGKNVPHVPMLQQTRVKRFGGFFILIPEGGEFPRCYGLAWREPWGRRAVCAPIPLNILIGWSRLAYYGLMHGIDETERETMQADLIQLREGNSGLKDENRVQQDQLQKANQALFRAGILCAEVERENTKLKEEIQELQYELREERPNVE